ncbi:LysM peptidoglycan-binding domain-containing C40 family peptidase [Arthrobacter sp. I2-34]|uniref:LysM peptidoglycan-binding domain-containing C40 family peptidase n=1 Tax=Arthrobacter hankyongi TaxID=2904801 RepID=A0ABS9L2A6_9MICC|nr:NlpC/P60 family protein [Arthrobacter hankyongi]MCG2620770.1 LysM peptidoglycan-binding domain-containing C40 family peptidase [Arthrobacter hankyongi]
MFKSNRARHRAVKSSNFNAITVGRSAAVLTAASGIVLTAGMPAQAYAGSIDSESYTAPASQTEVAPAAAKAATSAQTHTVLPGDTLANIAAQYGVSLDDVFAANGLDASSIIYPGDSIKLSGGAAAAAPAAKAAQSDTSSFSVSAASVNIKPVSASSSSIASLAKSMVGSPYVWGGTSTSGWDCSGFTKWVYAQHGISLPRVTTDQAAALTPTGNPQPGDLVLQNGGSHIGIYLGGGQMVSALNPADGTQIHSVNAMPVDGYYTAR